MNRRCFGGLRFEIVHSWTCVIPVDGRQGFVYAGQASNGLVKIGSTLKQCPLCRMDQNCLAYLGIVWVKDARVFEQMLISAMGTPAHGSEWFENLPRIQKLIANGWLKDVFELALFLAREIG